MIKIIQYVKNVYHGCRKGHAIAQSWNLERIRGWGFGAVRPVPARKKMKWMRLKLYQNIKNKLNFVTVDMKFT